MIESALWTAGRPADQRSDRASGDAHGRARRERAAAPDHQGAAAPPLRPQGREPARRPAFAGSEETEQVEAEGFAAEDIADPAKREARARKRRANRGSLPAHLPRIEQVIDIPDKICPCCKGMLHVMGEDCSERLDIVPAQFRVIATRRPKYACRSCEEVVVQAPAHRGSSKAASRPKRPSPMCWSANIPTIFLCIVRRRSMPAKA